jgi:hypothetical protein
MVGREHNRVVDKAILVFLDLAYHGGLLLGRAVVVQDTNTTEQRHVDSHVGFRHRVHGTADKRRLERNVTRQLGLEHDLVGRKVDEARKD